MGWDRRVLPKDRDSDETYPWMGLISIALIVGGILLVIWLVFGVFGEDVEPADLPDTLRILSIL